MEKIYKDNEFMEYPKEKRMYNLSIETIPVEWIKDLSNRLKDEDEFEKAMFLLDVIDVWRVESEVN